MVSQYMLCLLFEYLKLSVYHKLVLYCCVVYRSVYGFLAQRLISTLPMLYSKEIKISPKINDDTFLSNFVPNSGLKNLPWQLDHCKGCQLSLTCIIASLSC